MALTSDLATFFLPITGIDPARIVGVANIGAGYCVNNQFVGCPVNVGLKYLANPDQLLDSDWPLILFGPSGTGKTAIALSIASRVTDGSPGKLAALTAKDFCHRFANAIETNSTAQFRQSLFAAAGLFLDDIDQLKKYPAAQNELTFLLDQLAIQSKPVIMTADPQWLDSGCLVPKLHSRLTSGLCLHVHPPGYDARRLIIADTAAQFDCSMSIEVCDYLSTVLSVTYPRIQLFFAQLGAWLKSQSISERQIDRTLLDSFFEHSNRYSKKRSVDSILRLVSKATGIRVIDIKGKSRQQSTALARCIVVYFLRHHLNMSFAGIGQVVGGRDHSTIMHSLKRVEMLIFENEVQATALRELEQAIIENQLAGMEADYEQPV